MADQYTFEDKRTSMSLLKSDELRRFQKDQYRQFKRKASSLGFEVPQTLAQYEAETGYYALLKLCDDPDLIHTLFTVKMKNGDINYVKTCKKLTALFHEKLYNRQ